MTPLYFGHGGRRLFGVYTPARAGFAGDRAVVLCHPWGQEYLRAHRSMKQLAMMLSGAGYHVMRFDYFGTGDSSGDMIDGDLEGWVDDIVAALQEIQDTTGAARVRLVGLRLGATLAAMAAAQHPSEVEALVLWDPIVSGTDYLLELLATEAWTVQGMVPPPPRPVGKGGGHEILGFPLTDGMARELQAVDLPRLVAKLPARVLGLASRSTPVADPLARALQQRGSTSSFEEIPCLPAWLEDRNSGAGAVPIPALQRIVQWMQ